MEVGGLALAARIEGVVTPETQKQKVAKKASNMKQKYI